MGRGSAHSLSPGGKGSSVYNCQGLALASCNSTPFQSSSALRSPRFKVKARVVWRGLGQLLAKLKGNYYVQLVERDYYGATESSQMKTFLCIYIYICTSRL